jgi:hypothetical protein
MPKRLSNLARREWRQVIPLLLERGTLSQLDGKATGRVLRGIRASRENGPADRQVRNDGPGQ